MGITIDGSSAAGNIDLGTNGTITDLAVGGLPDGTIDNGCMADDAIDSAELADGGIDSVHLASGVGGKILQVQTALITAVETIACNADTTSGFSTVAVAITPASSSNKILLSFTINGEGNAANEQKFSTNVRKAISGGATTTLPAAAGSRTQVFALTGDLTDDATYTPSTFSVVNYPDPAGATSAITYTVRFMYQYASASAGTYYLNRRAATDTDAAGVPRFNSWITAMEVAA